MGLLLRQKVCALDESPALRNVAMKPGLLVVSCGVPSGIGCFCHG